MSARTESVRGTGQQIRSAPARSAAAASRTALGALILRDLMVLRKHFGEFVARTLVQPFLLVFAFLYVFPTIGQGIGGGGGARSESAFATVLVPGVVGIAIMFQGIQAVALQLASEFGYTREIEDRVQAPCPIWLVAMAKVFSGAVQGMISALLVFPIAAVVHAKTYYEWTRLAPVRVGGFPWLQALVLVNPLIYINEGMRAALTDAPHMHLYIGYPVLIGFMALFLGLGLRNFRRRVLS